LELNPGWHMMFSLVTKEIMVPLITLDFHGQLRRPRPCRGRGRARHHPVKRTNIAPVRSLVLVGYHVRLEKTLRYECTSAVGDFAPDDVRSSTSTAMGGGSDQCHGIRGIGAIETCGNVGT
jgi:hypothetical protein